MTSVDDSANSSRKLRLRFSLLALFIAVTLICLLLAWWVQPNRVVATALFHVKGVPPTVLAVQPGPRDRQDYETLKKTQVALLKSHFVLNSAVRKPGIAALPMLQGTDPVEWLADRLVVEFPENGEILSIRLFGLQENAADLVQLVDAVARAYQDEVVYREKQRHLSERDLLARSLEKLNSKISRKMEEVFDIIRAADQAESDDDAMQQLLMKRLDRVEIELMRLENEQLQLETSGEPGNSAFYEQRVAQLRERQSELERQITRRAETSVELTTRRTELKRLERLADQLAARLEMLDIESQSPPRIEMIQPAIAAPAD